MLTSLCTEGFLGVFFWCEHHSPASVHPDFLFSAAFNKTASTFIHIRQLESQIPEDVAGKLL